MPEDSTLSSRFDVHSIFLGGDGLRAGWSLLLFLLFSYLLYSLTAPLIAPRHGAAPTTTTAASREMTAADTLRQDGALFLIVAVSSVAMSRIEQRPLGAYGIGRTPGGLRQFGAGLVWGVVLFSVLVLLLRAAHLLMFDGRLVRGPAVLGFGAEWLAGFLAVAFFEEYFLRGFLQFTLARGLTGVYGLFANATSSDALGFWTAALVLSFVFGIGHGLNAGESPIGLLTAGCAALVFTASLWRTGSLWWAIGFHATWDWAQSFLYGVPDSGVMVRGHLLASHASGRTLLSGGLTGPEGSLLVFPVLLVIVLVIFTTLPRTARAVGAE